MHMLLANDHLLVLKIPFETARAKGGRNGMSNFNGHTQPVSWEYRKKMYKKLTGKNIK